MMVEHATQHDTPAIYALLREARFHHLPDYGEARPILERANALIVKRNGKVLIWAAYHGYDNVLLDLVISPEMPKGRITKGICKEVLAAGFELSHNNSIAVESYNPKGIKAALAMGFKLADLRQEDGWVKLTLSRDEFERKFVMRGKPL
jgi:hypothetical protein